MHPIEHLRFLARSSGFDNATLVQEAAYALSAMPDDLPMLVVVSRRLIERHPTCAPLWWLCSQVLTAQRSSEAAWDANQQLEDDPTFHHLTGGIDVDQTVAVAGWSRAAEVLSADRSDCELTLDPNAADVVVVEAVAASPRAVLLASDDARLVESAASTVAGDRGGDAGATVIVVCPLGTRLPGPAVDEIERRAGGGGDVVRLAPDLFHQVVHSGGADDMGSGRGERVALTPDGTFAPELLLDTRGT